jgi:hypothetical protein
MVVLVARDPDRQHGRHQFVRLRLQCLAVGPGLLAVFRVPVRFAASRAPSIQTITVAAAPMRTAQRALSMTTGTPQHTSRVPWFGTELCAGVGCGGFT